MCNFPPQSDREILKLYCFFSFSLEFFKLCSQMQVVVFLLDFLSYSLIGQHMFIWALPCAGS